MPNPVHLGTITTLDAVFATSNAVAANECDGQVRAVDWSHVSSNLPRTAHHHHLHRNSNDARSSPV